MHDHASQQNHHFGMYAQSCIIMHDNDLKWEQCLENEAQSCFVFHGCAHLKECGLDGDSFIRNVVLDVS